MKKSVTRQRVGEKNVRVILKLEGEKCNSSSMARRKELVNLLETLMYSPDLLLIEGELPMGLAIFYKEGGWVLDASIVRPEGDEGDDSGQQKDREQQR